jgi:hypothetical protein
MNLVIREAVVLSSAKEFLREAQTYVARRFWKQAAGYGDACWTWQGVVNAQGYGVIIVSAKRWLAHRLCYSLVYGEIPDGMQVQHTCDLRPCVNPSHLKLGTPQDNMDDMKARGRGHGNTPRYWQKGIDA